MTIFARARLFQTRAAVAAALLAVGAAAPVQAEAQEVGRAGAVEAESESRSDRRICVVVERADSLIPRRICQTAAQWQRGASIPTN